MRILARIIVSLIVGFLVPFVYMIITGPLSVWINNDRINHLLWLPIGWPVQLYRELNLAFSGFPFETNEGMTLAFIIIGNMLPGTILTFIVLSVRASRRAAKEVTTPPSPPDF